MNKRTDHGGSKKFGCDPDGNCLGNYLNSLSKLNLGKLDLGKELLGVLFQVIDITEDKDLTSSDGLLKLYTNICNNSDMNVKGYPSKLSLLLSKLKYNETSNNNTTVMVVFNSKNNNMLRIENGEKLVKYE